MEAFEQEDFDEAISAMESLGDFRDARERAREFRVEGARKMLASARRKLRGAPQAAVAQARTSLRYHATPEAREFLARAREELRAFQRRQRALGRDG